jgi:alpha-glucoside transport system permease protein
MSASGTPVSPTGTLPPEGGEVATPGPSAPVPGRRMHPVLGLVVSVVMLVVLVLGIGTLFQAFVYYPEYFPKMLQGFLAIIAGVLGAAAIFYFINMFVESLPQKASGSLMPYAFLLPALGLIGLILIYPTVQTINYSFANSDSTAYVGLQNYIDIFQDSEFLGSLWNNLLWLIIVPASTVAIGLLVAVLADKLSASSEKVSKSVIFLPMAISFVGASAIWGFVYAYDPPGEKQVGLLNAIWVALGGDPVSWLSQSQFSLNDILLMVILIWLQVGFSMILLSSAIKGVPEDTLEAARIDGASELQIFFQVVVPQIKGTMITVYITVLILVLKVFDIVYVMTNGRDGTNVIANLFFQEIFANSQAGIAASIVVVLLVAVMPVLVYQVRHFRAEEANR